MRWITFIMLQIWRKIFWLHRRLNRANPSALFIPCSSHSLHWIWNPAAECCEGTALLFYFIENVYVCWSISLHGSSMWQSHLERVNEKHFDSQKNLWRQVVRSCRYRWDFPIFPDIGMGEPHKISVGLEDPTGAQWWVTENTPRGGVEDPTH